jgi:hypothetical protein
MHVETQIHSLFRKDAQQWQNQTLKDSKTGHKHHIGLNTMDCQSRCEFDFDFKVDGKY